MNDIPGDPVVNVHEVLASFDALWSPRIAAQVNDYDVRLAKVRGEYVWHRHPDTDELFLVLDGRLDIGVRDEHGREHRVVLERGDVYVVPRDLLHCPSSDDGAEVLIVEPTGTVTTGDFDGPVPDHIDSTTGHTVQP